MTEETNGKIAKMRKTCWENALKAFGTSGSFALVIANA